VIVREVAAEALEKHTAGGFSVSGLGPVFREEDMENGVS
jgi:uncharacterized protein YfaT (DUF1175 family)